MKILKRDGRFEQLSFDKVIYRLRKLCNDESLGVLSSIDPDIVAQRVVNSIYDGVSSSELDEEAARIAVSFTENPEFGKLASRIVVSNLHKSTHECFSEVMEILYNNKDSHDAHSPLIAHDVIEIVRQNKNRLNFVLDYKRDYMFDYFGFKTLERSYLLKMKNGEHQKVIERPQHMYMRVALGIHKHDIENAIKTYDLISQGYYTHATPTMFNSGTPLSQLSSCFDENTIVATVNKGPIKIKDVQLGDLVVTHNGNIKPVVQLHRNPLNDRTLYEINIAKTEKIKVTDNHKLWVIPKGNRSPQWVDVESLKTGDYVGIPNKKSIGQKYFIDLVNFKDHMTGIKNRQSQYDFSFDDDVVRLKTIWSHSNLNNHSEITCSRRHSEVKRFWKITDDFAKFIGIYYGDGHIMSKKDNNGDSCIRGIGITIHKDNIKLRDFCAKVGQTVFGVNASYHTMKSQNIIQVLFNSPIVGEVFVDYFGRGFNGKKIWTQMFQWDKNLVTSLLHGIISTDGCVSKEGSISIQMSNVSFMRELYYLVRNVGIDISYGNERIQKNATQHHVQMNIPRDEIDLSKIDKIYKDDRMVTLSEKETKVKNQHASKVVDGFKFIKFVSKKKVVDDLPEYVYTLGVEDDHSYNVGGIIAENCFLLGTQDSIDGIFKTITDCARISKLAGGIGIHISNIRAKGSLIRGTNGQSDGIAPMLKVYNDVATYVNQCFTPDTWVYSKNGPKQIKDVTTSDQLVTIDGTFKKVNEVIKNNVSKEILEIRATNTLFPLKVTKEHEIYLIKGQKKITNFNLIKNRLDKKIVKPDFYNASEMTEDDLVGYPIPTYVSDFENEDLDFYKFYGLMLGDGHHRNNGYHEYGIHLSDTTKQEEQEFVKSYLTKYNVSYWTCDHPGCTKIGWYDKGKLGLTRDMLYDEKNEKRIVDSLLHLPKTKTLKLIEGLLKSDGSNLKELYFHNTSQQLVMQLRYLFLRVGILTSGHVRDNRGESHVTKNGRTITTRKVSYVLRIPKHQVLEEILTFKKKGQFLKYFEWNGMLWGRIKSISKINYTGDVYDFNMIDNHNYLTDMGLVHNSGKRKGSFAMYIEPWHADIFDFLEMRKNQGHEDLRARDLFYALWIPDLFMRQVKENGDWHLMCPDECPGLPDVYGKEFEDLYSKYVEEKRFKKVVKAQDLWTRILEAQIETGQPYMLYKDSVNEKSNQKNVGTVKSSNLCVAPETMFLTDTGYHQIRDLENKEVKVWNGKEWSKTTVHKTGENQELLKIKFSNGSELECTPYHKFYIATGKRPNQYPRIKQIEAKDLTKDMKLIKSDFPIIKDGSDDFPYPYEHGLFTADGTYEQKKETTYQCSYKPLSNENFCGYHVKMYKNENDETIDGIDQCQAFIGHGLPRLSLYGEKKKLAKYLTTRVEVLPEDNNGRINCRLPLEMKPKYSVPVNCNLDIKLRWLEGLVDGDGCICKSDDSTAIQVSSIDKEFLNNVKYLLQTLGCDPKIVIMHLENQRHLPNHRGGYELYECKDAYRLLISGWDVAKLYELGFKPNRLSISGIYPRKNTKRWIKMEEMVYTNRLSDTYCFTEEKRGMGIFNGVITGQCAEITLYSDDKEYAVCNLESVALPMFVKRDENEKPLFDHQHLYEVTKSTILSMNRVIDNNYYPTEETRRSNFKHRPLGIGVQGLHDVYIMMKHPFESEDARQLNREIFETIYFACLEGSMELAKVDGPYETFDGSPMSQGLLQFDLWAQREKLDLSKYLSGRWDWDKLKEDIKKFGVRNSMLTCCQPTASTAQILGNTECIEPVDSCIFKRRVLSGEFTVINRHLVRDLQELGIWSKEMKDKIILNNGSIQTIEEIPKHIRELYKTVWEISQKALIDQSADRGLFIDQTQSLNLFVANPTFKKLTSMHFYAHSKGVKTGLYYLRSKGAATAAKFSVDANLEKQIREKQEKGSELTKEEETLLCSIDNKEACMMCQ